MNTTRKPPCCERAEAVNGDCPHGLDPDAYGPHEPIDRTPFRPLTPTEIETVFSALVVAAERYRSHISLLESGQFKGPAVDEVRKQFERQAEDCQALAALFTT